MLFPANVNPQLKRYKWDRQRPAHWCRAHAAQLLHSLGLNKIIFVKYTLVGKGKEAIYGEIIEMLPCSDETVLNLLFMGLQNINN